MATTRSFSAMLNDYLPNVLLKEEFMKRDYVLSHCELDEGWVGASSTSNEAAYIVPFKAAGGSSVAFGALTDASDIAEDQYVRGRVATAKEAWGSMIFNHRDIMEHNKVSEKNLLKLLPGSVEDFMDYMKNLVSMNLLNGESIAALSADGDASGNFTVADPARFVLGQKIYIDDGDSSPTYGYIRSINMNTGVITLYDARSAGAVVNISGYTTAQSAKVYNAGQQSAGFLSLKGSLLSSANGGDSTLYGVTKTAYPYTQSINVLGSGITSVNIMEQIFDAVTTVRRLGKGRPTDILMSYKNLGSCMKVIEGSKGSYNVKPGSQSASQYGWTELEVGSVAHGGMKLIGVQECDDSEIYILDWRGIKFASNGMFQKRKSPDGNEYFEVRATTGYSYIVDVCLFGELIVERPSYQGIIYSISY